MTLFEAVHRVDISPEAYDHEEILEAWQWLHDSGDGYELQGWYGRTLRNLLEQGLIRP